jgi:DNA-binding IclR family transcriptional regulator
MRYRTHVSTEFAILVANPEGRAHSVDKKCRHLWGIEMNKALDQKLVKSALRALEVLEFFTEDRPVASVNDVARHYQYPQSSTSELMNCLVSLGYLRRDEGGRRFVLSSRVATLGSWVQPMLFRQGRLYALMDEMASAARATVVLAGINAARLQVLHVVGSAEDRSRIYTEDPAVSVLHSAEGLALVSTYPVPAAKGLVHRLNSELDKDFRIGFPDIKAQLDAATAQGYVAIDGPLTRRSLAIVLPHATGGERLALGVRPGPDSPDEETILRMLRNGFVQHLGLAAIAVGEALPRKIERAAV